MSVDDTNAMLRVYSPGGDRWVEVIIVVENHGEGSSEVVITTPAGKLRVPIRVNKGERHSGEVFRQ